MKKLAIPCFWLFGVVGIALAGLQPNPYLEKVRSITAPRDYPVSNVFTIAVMMTIFAIVCHAILRPRTYIRA
jgi:hypothetical protein